MIAAAPGANGSLVILSSSKETGWNPTAFACGIASTQITNPATTHLPQRTIVTSPRIKCRCRCARFAAGGKGCTRGDEVAFCTATAIPPPPESGPLEPESGNRRRRLEYSLKLASVKKEVRKWLTAQRPKPGFQPADAGQHIGNNNGCKTPAKRQAQRWLPGG